MTTDPSMIAGRPKNTMVVNTLNVCKVPKKLHFLKKPGMKQKITDDDYFHVDDIIEAFKDYYLSDRKNTMTDDMSLDIKEFPALHRLVHPRHKNFSLYVRDIPGEIYSMYLREGLSPPEKIPLSIAIKSGYPEDTPTAPSSPEITPIPTDEELSDGEEHDESCPCRGCGGREAIEIHSGDCGCSKCTNKSEAKWTTVLKPGDSMDIPDKILWDDFLLSDSDPEYPDPEPDDEDPAHDNIVGIMHSPSCVCVCCGGTTHAITHSSSCSCSSCN